MERSLVIETCAAAAHEANRYFCLSHEDRSQAPWDSAPDWQKASARIGVEGVMKGNGPKESHESWLAHKKETGWKYGPIKNEDAKEHPCFVPYDELPPHQQAKDLIFVETVRTMLKALRYKEKK
jgi:hypothetical protein